MITVLTDAKLEGIYTEERFGGYTAMEYAEQRKNVPLTWSEAFMDLLRSINRKTEVAENSTFPEGRPDNTEPEETEGIGEK